MAHPKRKTSTTRRDKGRTHNKVIAPTLLTCPTTNKNHLPHHALWEKGNLYYKGVLILEKAKVPTISS